jgi:hypothetical protein
MRRVAMDGPRRSIYPFRVGSLFLLAGLSSLLLSLPLDAAAPPPLPPDPEIVLTFEKETYVASHQVGPEGTTTLRSPIEDHYRTAVFGASFDAGVAGQCVRFKSTEDAVEVLDTPLLDKATAVTVSAWVKLDEILKLNYVVSKEDWRGGKEHGFVLRILADGVAEFTVVSGAWIQCTAPGIKTGTWRHLVGTCDAKTISIWIDGKRAASVPLKGPMEPSRGELAIGRGNFDKKRGFVGCIDEVALYDRVLKDAEIAGLYRRGKAGEVLAKASFLAGEPEPDGKEAKKAAGKGNAGDPARPAKLFAGQGCPARLLALGEGKFGLLAGLIYEEDKRLEFRAGDAAAGIRFGEPVKIEMPDKKKNYEAIDAVADSKGTAHVFLVENVSSNVTDAVVHCLRISAEGKIVLPWFSLTSKLGLDRQPYPPAVLPQKDGKLLFLATGRDGKSGGSLVAAEATPGGVRPLSKQTLAANRFSFSLEGSLGRVVATGPKNVWLVDIGMEGERSWVNVGTGKKTPWFSAPGGGNSWIDEDEWTVSTAGGLVYAAAHAGKGDGRGSVPAKLLLARSKAGEAAKLVEVPGKFRADARSALIPLSKGGMFLLTVAGWQEGGSGKETLELWDVSAAKPAKAATVCEGILHEVAAAPMGDNSILVVFNDQDTWYGAAVPVRKR